MAPDLNPGDPMDTPEEAYQRGVGGELIEDEALIRDLAERLGSNTTPTETREAKRMMI